MNSKEALVAEAVEALKKIGVNCTLWGETDVRIHCEFLDATWGSGNKQILYDAAVLYDETKQEIMMWELTKESGGGFSFGSSSESSFQTGKTLFRKVKSVQYGVDGQAYEINLDIGAIAKVFKDISKQHHWKFHTVLNKNKALYSAGSPVDVPVGAGGNHPVNPPADQPVSQQVSQQVSQPVSQPVNQQVNQPTNGNRAPKEKQFKPLLFWIPFVLLAALVLILIIGQSGIVFTVGSLVIMVLLILMRKKIGVGLLHTLVGFVATTIVLFIVFAVSVTLMDSKSSETSQNSEVAVTTEATIETVAEAAADNSNIAVAGGFSRTVDSVTLAPVEKTTKFTQDDMAIYFSVLCKAVPKNAELMVNWYLNGSLAMTVGPEKFSEGLTDRYYTASLTKGAEPFPVGDYKVEFIFSLDGKSIFSATDLCEVVASSSASSDNAILFEDAFQRADGDVAGSAWREVKMRNGTGNTQTVMEAGDSPWRITGNALSYVGTGNGTYTEDYIQTVDTYPIENVLVEFELKGSVATSLGYVGPGAFWAPDPEVRLGGFSTSDPSKGLIGVQASYGWETGGTSGLAYWLAGGAQSTKETFGGLNQEGFVKHAFIVKEGMLYYTVGDGEPQAYQLKNLPEPGAKRHLSFDVRYYDNLVPFSVAIKNLKITQLP